MAGPDIFLSYNREDAGRARQFAEGFAAQGFDVWWDVALRSGEAYDKVTEDALRRAGAVVVLWSPRSVDSRWVRAEATLADRNKTLVPAMIEACDRPIMFELTQTADLSHWRGDTGDQAWRAFVGDVRRFIGRSEPGGPSVAPDEPAKTRPALPSLDQIAIVVLPFANMSRDDDQEYFADGITEDIITDLSKVSALMVIARNTAFTFKGQHVDVADVARQLNVTHVLEGSVRKAGNRLRVTAQLIDGSTGGHVWADRYDRDLDDIFELQDELSQAIVGALRVKLLPDERKALKDRETDNVEAYDLLVRARALHSTMAPSNLPRAAAIYREVLQLDPNIATAWAGVASTNLAMGVYDIQHMLAARAEIDHALAQAAALAPDASRTIGALCINAGWSYDWAEVERCVSKRLGKKEDFTADLNHPLVALGRAQQAAEFQLLAVRADPLSVGQSFGLQYMLDAAGRLDEAEKEYERSKDLRANRAMTGWRAATRAMVHGDHERVRRIYLEEFDNDVGFMPFRPQLLEVLDRPEAALGILRTALTSPACANGSRQAAIANWAIYFGDEDLALAALRRGLVEQKHGIAIVELWFPNLAGLRQNPGFKDIVRDVGLADHWRKTGNWGDFARPLGDDDFEMIA